MNTDTFDDAKLLASARRKKRRSVSTSSTLSSEPKSLSIPRSSYRGVKRVDFISSVTVPKAEDIEHEREWIIRELKRIGEKKLSELVAAAKQARERSYSPYSQYKVGVSILCSSGRLYAAPNTEVVSYSQTGHAEHNAINKAISEGEGMRDRKFIEAVVVCHAGTSESCGACRQEIAEHCENVLVLDIDPEGNPVITTSLKILLPYAFTPNDLSEHTP